MIGSPVEQRVRMKDVAKFLELPPEEKPPCYGTILLWATRGVRGVVLETIWIGGRKYTTREAIARFQVALNSTTRMPLPGGIDVKATDEASRKLRKILGRDEAKQRLGKLLHRGT